MDTLDGFDTSQRFLEATTHTVAWFWNRLRNEELQMKPPFQRNPVWQEAQKAYLIDSIIRGYPVPELYLQTTVSAEGKEQHVIVDGQQRVRACLEFINNDWALGEQSGALAGFSFEQVSDEIKRRVFEYKFVIRSLPPLPDAEVREIFGRLNRNNVALNRQELRHATYWGEFISCMERLSQSPFWVRSGIFTSNDFRRMLDIEYVSELAIATLYGPQNKKTSLDGYYASFESEFPDREILERTFTMVLGELAAIIEWPTSQRWSRKVDFYTLFLVMVTRAEQFPLDRQERIRMSQLLTEFSDLVTQVLIWVLARSEESFVRLYELFQEDAQLKRDLGVPVDERGYLDLARFWIDARGHPEGRRDFGEYGQGTTCRCSSK